jgi:outer membrane murein-binding lipoprotein Lpp
MTTFQKIAAVTAIVTLVAVGIYEARQATQLREQVQTLQKQQAPLSEQVGQLTKALADATNQLAALRDDNERLNRNTGDLLKLRGEANRLRNEFLELAQQKAGNDKDPTVTEAVRWKERVASLKKHLEQNPGAGIPELQFATEQDWLNATRGKLDSDADYRRALSALRNAGESKVAGMIKKTLAKFLRENSKQMPTDLSQLLPYFDPPIDNSILQRWEIVPAAQVKNLGLGADLVITQKSPVDEVFDTRYGIGPDGCGSTDYLHREIAPTMDPVYKAFRAANNGEWPEDVSMLQPYISTPEQQAALQKLILKNSNSKL